ncbi:phage tail-like protein [Peteryoungia aggregata LMG 23059]|uniref:Phage tail-like protein n=1 Tax=Peteryoungia aggregata LMG 23059 TaxID=1368425 RepID=A0ABU0GB05_9HYPH|nr:phage tail protein I [Peteryoungia aggregata]MDQ0422288.1 phage tail-like protein [Peteryoungia aggregata LMG 23059]
MTFKPLHPSNVSPLRKTVEEAMVRAFEVQFDLRSIDDPEVTPPDFVPFIAWGVSTDLWDRNWPLERKRAVAKAWFRLHSKKGTLAGIREAVRYFDSLVVGVRRPPDAAYPDPTLTKVERENYLARFKQLRFYSYRERGIAQFGAYLCSGYRLPRLFPGGKAFPFVSDAATRVGPRVFVFDPEVGREIPVRRVQRTVELEERGAVVFDEVDLPGSAGVAAFVGAPPKAKTYTVDTGASGRRYSVEMDTTYLEQISEYHLTSVLPTEDPVSVRPRKQYVRGQRNIGQLFPAARSVRPQSINRPDDGIKRTFLPATSAGLRIFDQIFLHDRDRQVDKRGARTFIGAVRLGMPPFHASLKIQSQGRISRFAVQQFVNGFFVKTSKAKLTNTIEAVRLSKSLRDKINVTAKTMRPATVADRISIGTINVDTWVSDL